MEWVIFAVIRTAMASFVVYRQLKRHGWVSPTEPRHDLSRPPRAAPANEDEYPVLLRMLLGDRAKAERLVAFEGRKAPDASRRLLIENAIDRLRHDLDR